MRLGAGRSRRRLRVEQLYALDVRRLGREGWLTLGKASVLTWHREGRAVASIEAFASAAGLTVRYRVQAGRGAWQDVHMVLRYAFTPAHFGGQRRWWLCPRCWQRVAVLYLAAPPGCCSCLNRERPV